MRELVANAGLEVAVLKRVRVGGYRLPRDLGYGQVRDVPPTFHSTRLLTMSTFCYVYIKHNAVPIQGGLRSQLMTQTCNVFCDACHDVGCQSGCSGLNSTCAFGSPVTLVSYHAW